MYELSPPEQVFALDLSKLKSPDITFWTVWENDQLLGCGALKELSAKHGEIKSMRTPAKLRGPRRRQGSAHPNHRNRKTAWVSLAQPGNGHASSVPACSAALPKCRLPGVRSVCWLQGRPAQLVHGASAVVECGLTPRSRRAPTAARASPTQAKIIIVLRGAYTLRCRARLTSNVRPQEAPLCSSVRSSR